MNYAFLIFGFILPLTALVALAVIARLMLRWFPRKRPPENLDRCKCGYLLDQLTIARCPECGRVIHFDATPEQLGLTDEELQRAQAARVRRRS